MVEVDERLSKIVGAAFASGRVERIGDGTRRICWRIEGTGLCVKFYRIPSEYVDITFPSVRRELARRRFDARRNANAEEVGIWSRIKATAPKPLAAMFPDEVALVFDEVRGYGIAETLLENADGTAMMKAKPYMKSTDDAEERRRVLGMVMDAVDMIVASRIRFFDMQNLMVQKTADGGLRLRIVDFEPTDRTLLPLANIHPWFVARKAARRGGRFVRELERLCVQSPGV